MRGHAAFNIRRSNTKQLTSLLGLGVWCSSLGLVKCQHHR
ncbi:Hypothetical protein LOCK900_2512 [Lacticaseibacillus rhamnosus LOCK900]|nr:Hypothetical protein LOCK900_2512 [Lacticaseibacillus rhamnosus LOCK900]EHJ33047.1 hypothetical protein HMPREF0541_01079 [Lacticaseibacillus rhamnosus ATCC 21052]